MRIYQVLSLFLIFISLHAYAKSSNKNQTSSINVLGCTSLENKVAEDVCTNINIAEITDPITSKPAMADVKSNNLINSSYADTKFHAYSNYGIKGSEFVVKPYSVFGKVAGGIALFETLSKSSKIMRDYNPETKLYKHWETGTLPTKINSAQDEYLTAAQDRIVARILQYEEANGKCDNGMTIASDNTFRIIFNTQEDAQKYLDDPATQLNNLTFCDSTQTPFTPKKPLPKTVLTQDCGEGLADLFHQDNAYTIDPTKDTSKLDNCITSIPKNATVVSVDIQSSASKLNNTGDIANPKSENYCGVNSSDGGFAVLSQRRAEAMKAYIQNKPLRTYTQSADKTISSSLPVQDDVFNINSLGSNGDDSSGIDPYTKGSLQEEYMSKEQYMNAYNVPADKVPSHVSTLRADLDKNKYVKVQIKYTVPPEEFKLETKFEIKCTPFDVMCIGTTNPFDKTKPPPPGGTPPVHFDLPDGTCAAYF